VIIFKSFFNVSQRKGNLPWEAYKKKGRMKALYSWERDFLEGPYEAMKWTRKELCAKGVNIES